MGRATQGVTLIAVEDGNKLSGLQRVVESDAEVETEAEADAGGNTEEGGGPTDRGPTDPAAE
jgi:DNA gyrase subunit A